MQKIIESKLELEYEPAYLNVENESDMHNVAPGSESHFKVTIVSSGFDQLMLVKRHRMINKTLQLELGQIHALALHTLTPAEWEKRGGVVAQSPDCHGGGKNQ
ncbi:MAG: BolA protein [Planctomycetota bacterium]|jgi:BolA protein